MEPQGVPGLVLAHWWAELGFGVGGYRIKVPGSSVGLLVNRTSQFLSWLTAGSQVFQSWCWPTVEWGWILGWLAEESKVSQT